MAMLTILLIMSSALFIAYSTDIIPNRSIVSNTIRTLFFIYNVIGNCYFTTYPLLIL